MWARVKHFFESFEFGRRNQQAFLEDLSSLIKDGVPANQAIRLIQETTDGITQDVAFSIAQGLAQGQPLAFGMKKWFSPAIQEIIRAGESSGTLAEAMEAAALALAQQTGAVGQFVNSTLYPFVVFVASMVMLVFVKKSVLANFVDFKPVAQWPDVGQT
ncbi:MAG TPA: type II secretion system F family protein, partial [Coxiellaceae bacterium]|nr:type II secretion system F family protein [Coxiellaceae bacterium]